MKSIKLIILSLLVLTSCSKNEETLNTDPIIHTENNAPSDIDIYAVRMNNYSPRTSGLLKHNLGSSNETFISEMSYSKYFNYYGTKINLPAIYDSKNNEIVAILNATTLFRFNLSDGTILKNELSSNDKDRFKGLTSDSLGNIYYFKQNTGSDISFAKYNLNNSSESVIAIVDRSDFLDSFPAFPDMKTVYSKSTNEVLFVADNRTLHSINISTGVVTKITLNDSAAIYKGISMDNNGNVYFFKDSKGNPGRQYDFVKYDLNSKSETVLANLDDSKYYGLFSSITGEIFSVYSSTTNEVITIYRNNKLFRINLSDGTANTINLSNSDDNYSGLVIK